MEIKKFLLSKEFLSRLLSLEALIAFPFITLATDPRLAIVFCMAAWALDYRFNREHNNFKTG